jgi:hypothetical protein
MAGWLPMALALGCFLAWVSACASLEKARPVSPTRKRRPKREELVGRGVGLVQRPEQSGEQHEAAANATVERCGWEAPAAPCLSTRAKVLLSSAGRCRPKPVLTAFNETKPATAALF